MTDSLQRTVEGTVMMLRCDSCGATFPHFSFAGDQDTDTAGLCSASSCDQNEVILVEADLSEWNDFEQRGASAIECRLAKQLGRNDLKILRMLGIEQENVPVGGVSFRDFRKAYKPPVIVYTCACCSDGKSRSVAELTIEDFQEKGGRIMTTGRLTL